VSEIDELYEQARSGDAMAFGMWAGRVERPVRASLWRFAAVADLEVVMQETLLRMWLIATRTDKVLEGENASLRMAIAVARNVAREEMRGAKLGRLVPIDDIDHTPELTVEPAPDPDPGLARAIRECIQKLPMGLQSTLVARIDEGHARPDRDIAAGLKLTLNTFLQRIVRARRRLADCLSGKGVELGGVVS
jgi:DNA-directed RNA polymerase specialized sigma24 family protein